MRQGFLCLLLTLLSLVGGPRALGTLGGPVGAARAAPALTLVPDHGPCAILNPPIVVRGDGFPPGLTLDVTARRAEAPPSQPRAVIGRATVAVDGTFTIHGLLWGCAPQVPHGAQFVIEAVDPTPPADGGFLAVLARATFTKTVAGSPDAATAAAWAALRARVPVGAAVYRPTWLPARFRQTTPEFVDGTFLGVSYRNSADDYLQFSIGGANSAAPTTAEPLAVHGRAGFLTFSDGSPPIGVNWQENGQSYGIRGGTSVTRTEILQVVDSLAPVGADGAFAPQCFPETGQCATGRFFAYWLAHGGLAINGYPLGDELDQQLEDGNTYRVQYFERTRLELHPENPPPYDVLLGQFGRRLHPADPPVAPRDGAAFFAATGHTVAPDLLAYWQAHGGLAQFGYPLSEEFRERLEDGQTYTVQYFERARFERHPESPPPDDILLGQFGRRILAAAAR
jgi:hypothetical protein